MSSAETPSPFPRPPPSPRSSSAHETPRNPILDSIHYSQYSSRETAHERANELQFAREVTLIREKQFEADHYNRLRRRATMPTFGEGYGGYHNITTAKRVRYVLLIHHSTP